jgi:peptidoglycan-N-acetylglucosamine deacetylase
MKTRPWILIPALAVLLVGVACESAQTQSQTGPQVVTVPADEMIKPPFVDSVAPAVGDSTPTTQAPPAEAGKSKKFSYNSCNVEGPFIAMTYDDGPLPGQTDRLLDMLKERGIKATFFVIGQNVEKYPQLIQRMVAEGHEVANHSWNHPQLTKLSAAGVESQITQTDAAIIAAGAPKPTIMRPPYGATNAAITRRMNEQFGQKVIMWSVDPLDWKYRNSSRVTEEILKNTKAGSIVLAHDIHPSTVNAMPGTLDALAAKGLKFVTVSELIAMDRPVAAAPAAPTSAAR